MQKKLRGEDDWMLPAVERKIEEQSSIADYSKSTVDRLKKSSKKSKKEKKSKKSKKEKKTKRKKKYSSSDSSESDEEEEDLKERKRSRKRKSSASESDEWVESGAKAKKADAVPAVQRDDWMSGMLIPTFTKKETAPKKDDRISLDKYDPKQSSRELNPFWKNGGSGLPTFKKPDSDEDDDDGSRKRPHQSRTEEVAQFRGNWRKKNATDSKTRNGSSRKKSQSPEPAKHKPRPKSPEWGGKGSSNRSHSPGTHNEICSSGSSSRSASPAPQPSPDETETKPRMQDFMTDQQMNDLGAKIIKAEIMGNADLAKSLKDKLEAARSYRANHKHELLASKSLNNPRKSEKEEVLLTATNSQGFSKPLQRTATASTAAPSDPWGGRGKKGNKKSKKVETHSADGERLRFFADDDKYDIKQMVSVFLLFDHSNNFLFT